jgi:hypothetical protein
MAVKLELTAGNGVRTAVHNWGSCVPSSSGIKSSSVYTTSKEILEGKSSEVENTLVSSGTRIGNTIVDAAEGERVGEGRTSSESCRTNTTTKRIRGSTAEVSAVKLISVVEPLLTTISGHGGRINYAVLLDNPDKLLARVVEGKLDLVRSAGN